MAAVGLALLLLLAAAPPAYAQLCSRDSQCGSRFSCQDWFLGLKTCQFQRCNADSDCPTTRQCVNGLCATRTGGGAGGGSGGGSAGGGGGGGGGGALCGKQTVNGVPHVYPMCARGFQCLQGHCREMAK
jgi:hypothetical protein